MAGWRLHVLKIVGETVMRRWFGHCQRMGDSGFSKRVVEWEQPRREIIGKREKTSMVLDTGVARGREMTLTDRLRGGYDNRVESQEC